MHKLPPGTVFVLCVYLASRYHIISCNMRFLLFVLDLVVFILFSVTDANAQDANNDVFNLSLEDLLNVQVVTATQRSQKLSEAPATVISYSAEQIESYGWRDLKDIFRTVTGVDVSYDVQGEVKSLVTFRGIEGNQKILVLQDGLRQNPIAGERFVFGHNIPLHIYKRVEIVFGPASAMYGADAYAGVVNLITKDGGDVNGLTGSLGYVSTNAGIANLTFGHAIGNDADVILSSRVYYGTDFLYHKFYKDSLDYMPVNAYQGELGKLQNVYPIKNWNLLAKVRYGKLIIGFDWQHELESNAPSCIPTNYAYVKNNVWGQDIRHLYFNYQAVKTETLDLSSNLTFGDYTINPISNFFIALDTDNDGLLDDGSAGYKYGYSGYFEGNIKADWTVSPKFNLIVGCTYNRVVSFPKTKNLDEPYHLDDVFGDDLSDFVDPQGYTFGLIGLVDSVFGERYFHNVAGYLQAEYKPSEKIIVTLGSRYDYNSIYKSTFNPRFGFVYKVADNFTLKALLGSAFIAPSNYYRWENWANPYAMHIPNMDIKPEKIQTYELSGFYYPIKSLSFRVSAYRNNMSDIIRPIKAPAQDSNYPYYNPMRLLVDENPNTGFVEINANLGKIYSQGVELDINYQFSKMLLSLGYSYTEGHDGELNSDIPKVSQHKANASVSYSNGKILGNITMRYYGDVWTARSNSYYNGVGRIPGAMVLYASLMYHLNKKLSISFSADNLLNTKHWNASPYGESIWIQPRAPQALMKLYFGINFKF